MAETITVTGLQETQRVLYAYSQQLGDRVVLGALRQGAHLVKRAAQDKAPIKTGNLRRGIVVRASRIHRGKSSKDLIGVYITIKKKEKTDPFYGRFQEDGWNTRGKANGARSEIRAFFGLRTGRKTSIGKTYVPGKKFIERAFIEKRGAAVDLITRSATAASEVLARKLGL